MAGKWLRHQRPRELPSRRRQGVMLDAWSCTALRGRAAPNRHGHRRRTPLTVALATVPAPVQLLFSQFTVLPLLSSSVNGS